MKTAMFRFTKEEGLKIIRLFTLTLLLNKTNNFGLKDGFLLMVVNLE